MKANFSITCDAAIGLIRMRITGFFEHDDILRLMAAREQALRTLGTAPNAHLTLVDARELDIFAKDSVAEFQRILSDPRHRARRIAFVIAKSLSSSQLRRAAHDRDAQYFTDPAEAETWLRTAPPVPWPARPAD